MYVILVYDVAVERVAKVLQVGRKYLTWVQNSVLEGELTPAQFARLKAELKRTADPSDAIRFYILPNKNALQVEVLGTSRNEPSQII